jgi:nitrogen fixation NifU-like protein
VEAGDAVSSDLRELYQQVILDHGRKPRNFGPLAQANHEAEGFNPLCGDRIHVFLRTEGDRLEAVRFTGSGCTICTASASMMTSAVQGKTRAEAEAMFRGFHDLVTRDDDGDGLQGALGKLAVFGGVREFPIRVKCATLPWHTLRAALEDRSDPVTTE